MSQAGARSERGDQYQLRLAIGWMIRLWTDPEVECVQAESLGMEGDKTVPRVDDIVVLRRGGRRIYIQAKKNQPGFKTWSLSDKIFRDELVKARDLLEADSHSEVWFYSRSPFGKLHKLQEDGCAFPSHELFASEAPDTLRKPLTRLAELMERSSADCFALLKRIRFKLTGDFDEIDRQHLWELGTLFARPGDGER